MNICRICRVNEADKTGSHIVPHFLLKRIENIDGKTGRDYEIGFSIGEIDSKSYFGRNILPEKLDEVYGKIDDNDIEDNVHPYIVDNLFCTPCENRLGVIENEYSKTITKIGKDTYESGVNFSIGVLFWGSIIWRLAIAEEGRLTQEQNEILREILDLYLPDNIKELNEKAINENEKFKSITYKLLRCNDCKEDDAKLLMLHPKFKITSCLFIDEFVVALSTTDQYKEFYEKDCFGMDALIIDAPTNKTPCNETIKPFDNETYKELNKKILGKLKEQYIEDLFKIFDEIHLRLGGQGESMPVELKNEILNDIIFKDSKIGRRYTYDELVISIYNVLKGHQI